MRAAAADGARLRLRIEGAVQGVGMRPFLYRAARDLGLRGWIRNDTRGVVLELEGPTVALDSFEARVRAEAPPRAVIRAMSAERLVPAGFTDLRIEASDAAGERSAAVLPDLATCPACLADIGLTAPVEDAPVAPDPAAPHDRRAGYPFTNCTDCGPRFSIIRALPYDRPNTTMASFGLCPACRAEYEDPLDRRFHAQPTACPTCGPHLTAVEAGARTDGEAVRWAADAVRAGEVVAVKGLGGFHLVVDAGNEAAVARLRDRKHRPAKPLAVMVRDVAMARRLAEVSAEAEALLRSPEAPILLLPRREASRLARSVAPGNPSVGVMLPYTPLHHLLLRELDRPVVATSGNLSDEPICVDNQEALDRLGGIADRFLVHDRPIARPVDDSVIQWSAGAHRPIRRSRGYAPLPIALPRPVPPVLAVGGQLKNTIALARGTDAFLSQHIGDLDTAEARRAFERVIDDFQRLYDVEPAVIAHDLHPEYGSTEWARAHAAGLPAVAVQHHHAHLAACLVDNAFEGPALGVVWDGTGLGPDRTIWGGEFLVGDASGYTRVAHLRPFRLPGGDAAIRDPARMALALAHAAWGHDGVERVADGPMAGVWEATELRLLRRMLDTGFRAPWTTSAGRLFDGVSALVGLKRRAGYEGEAAMALEYAVDPAESGAYHFPVTGPMVDWAPALGEILADVEAEAGPGTVAARFHNGLVRAIVEVAVREGVPHVALSGGVFQNVVLTERAAAALRAAGRTPLLHRQVPANDGGLALGQVAVAAAAIVRNQV